ncbi:MAG TPA: FHA domain-containing protein [Candidatus Binataceae bacterium]
MAARIRLVALASETLRAYPLVKKQTAIGSAPDNDVVIEHNSVSRRHAVLIRGLRSYAVRDLDSTNGTRVNGQRASGTCRVESGDELEFGSVRFAVMNSPRRGGALGVRGTMAIVVLLTLAGFALGHYLWMRQPVPRSAPPPAAPAAQPSAAPVAQGAPARAPAGAPATVPKAKGTYAAATDGTRPLARPLDEFEWLRTLNDYRAMAGLAVVREDPAFSASDFAHARYLVKNAGSPRAAMAMGAEVHSERPDKPWYSEAGLRAARSGDIDQWFGMGRITHPPPGWAIDHWVASTWHRLALLNPRLNEVGYGEFCENGACAAVLDVLNGIGAARFAPAAAPGPVRFPPEGATVHLNALSDEWPDPLTACRGYSLPAGLPITMQLGAMVPARLSAYSLRRDSASEILEACGYDAFTYVNPGSADQASAGGSLSELGAVVVIPRQPLASGNYTVEMTVNGRSYRWRFSIQKDD